MATLLHGPRLGAPSSSGFKVWLRFDGAATCVLETRAPGGDWLVQDTQAVDTGLDNTVVMSAAGLNGATLYDYRVTANSVVVASSSTMTMPEASRFVLYFVSDGHGQNQTAYDAVRSDWETTYEPLGIPAFILQGGDLVDQIGFTAATKREWLDTGILPEIAELCGAGRATERLPLVYMWDDWDFAGNNSSRNSQLYFTSEADTYIAAQEVWDILWRDHSQPDPPSRSYVLEVAGVPLVVVDNRSQRTHRVGTAGVALTGLRGDESLQDNISFVGLAHRAWLISTLRQYADRGLAFLSTGTTLIDGASTIHGAAARDSIGLSFRAERNYLLQQGWPATRSGYLLVLSGDDHANRVYRRGLGAPAITDGITTVPVPRDGYPVGFDVWELKVDSSDNLAVFGTTTTFGYGDMFEGGAEVPVFLRFDITPSLGGKYVEADIAYVDATTGLTVASTLGPSAGKVGHFFYRSGTIQYTDGSVQKYPVENSPAAAPVFGLAYLDDIAGTLHTEDDAFRSHGDETHGAIIRSIELYEQEEDRDTLVRQYERAPEANPPLP